MFCCTTEPFSGGESGGHAEIQNNFSIQSHTLIIKWPARMLPKKQIRYIPARAVLSAGPGRRHWAMRNYSARSSIIPAVVVSCSVLPLQHDKKSV